MSLSPLVACAVALLALPTMACSSPNDSGQAAPGPTVPTAGATSGAGTHAGGSATTSPTGGAGGAGSPAGSNSGAAAGSPSSSVAGAAAGGGAGDASHGGTGGGGTNGGGGGGSSGGGGSGGGGSGTVDPCGTPAPRALSFEAADGQHIHMVDGRPAAVYGGVPHLMGKLIVQLDNNTYSFGLKRGFHVLGVNLPVFNTGYTTRNFNGDCRLEAFDGVDRCPDFAVTPAESVTGQVTQSLKDLQAMFPEEDWGYFLNADGSVRWSDVGFTGHSHRAQSATRFAVAVCAYRAVARSGPRDNVCGTGQAAGDFDPQNPPYDPNCPPAKISAWLDDAPKTPIDRFFGFVGKMDDEYGDIQFSMERMKFLGKPVNVSTGKAPYDGTHRFYADAGHDGFDSMPYWDALNIAWGVPAENAAWALTH